ncbi:MAG: hypothetical protein AB1649_19105, partial [Chloroflexota bacterium]
MMVLGLWVGQHQMKYQLWQMPDIGSYVEEINQVPSWVASSIAKQGVKMANVQFSNIYWKRVLLAGIGITLLTTVLIFLMIGVYAMALAVQAQGAPDNAKIEAFANQIGQWGTPVIALLLTVILAIWVARKTEAAIRLNSIFVGLIAAITG